MLSRCGGLRITPPAPRPSCLPKVDEMKPSLPHHYRVGQRPPSIPCRVINTLWFVSKSVGIVFTGIMLFLTSDSWWPLLAGPGPQHAVVTRSEDQSAIHGFSLTEDEQTLMVQRKKGHTYLGSPENQQPLDLLAPWGEQLTRVSLSPDGKLVVAGFSDGSIHFLDRDQLHADNIGQPGGEAHTLAVDAIAFSHDGTRLLTGAADAIKLWDTTTRECLLTHSVTGIAHRLQFSADDSRIVGVIGGNLVKVWDAETLEQLLSYKHNAWVVNACFVADSNRILSADWYGHLKFRSVDGLVAAWDSKRDLEYFWGLAVTRDGRHLALSAGRSRRTIHLISLEDLRVVSHLDGHAIPPVYMKFTRDGSRLFSGSHDGQLMVWDLNNTPIADPTDTEFSYFQTTPPAEDDDSLTAPPKRATAATDLPLLPIPPST